MSMNVDQELVEIVENQSVLKNVLEGIARRIGYANRNAENLDVKVALESALESLELLGIKDDKTLLVYGIVKE